MLNEDIEKTLQKHSPALPAGFAERSDAQVLKLMTEGKQKHRFNWKTVLVCAMLMVLGITTALAATVEDVNTVLYRYWPEAAEFLMPLNVSCENQGIRMEVLSAAVGQRDALITFSLQDLEGDRINELTETGIDLEGLFPIYTEAATETRLLSYDAETKTAVYAEEIRTNGMSLPEGGKATLTLTGLRQHEIVDLLPLLKQYEARTDTVSLPENSQPMSLQNATGVIPKGMKVLDPAGSLEIPLAEHTYLCGYGWIDGLLHVQIRYDNPVNENNEFPVLGTLRLQTPDGYSSYDHPDELREGVTGFWWDEDDNGSADRDEFLFACTPADLENATLELDIRKFLGEDTVKGNWSIPIPMRMIQYHE